MVMLVGALVFSRGNKPASRQRRAYAECQKFVKHRLKSPARAAFPTYGPGLVRQIGTQEQYVVVAHVDVKRSSGSPVRAEFTCEVTRSGHTWQLRNLAGSGSAWGSVT